jgi:capsular exopolysaccharide synthesis family protein
MFHLRGIEETIREVISNPNTMAGEHYRLVRAKLSAMQKNVGLKSIMITSAIPNEGKTFSSCCLAGILAQEPGKKVLLIDADFRTSSAGRVLGVGRGPIGLADVLRSGVSGYADIERALIKCSEMELYLLPAGVLARNPAELLGSADFEAMMRHAQQHFNWIIIDSPPVLAVADASLIAPITDASLLVMHTGKTGSSLLKDAVKRIGPERICGVVLNRAKNLKTNRYYSYYQSQIKTS